MSKQWQVRHDCHQHCLRLCCRGSSLFRQKFLCSKLPDVVQESGESRGAGVRFKSSALPSEDSRQSTRDWDAYLEFPQPSHSFDHHRKDFPYLTTWLLGGLAPSCSSCCSFRQLHTWLASMYGTRRKTSTSPKIQPRLQVMAGCPCLLWSRTWCWQTCSVGPPPQQICANPIRSPCQGVLAASQQAQQAVIGGASTAGRGGEACRGGPCRWCCPQSLHG